MDSIDVVKSALVHINQHIGKHLISTILFVFLVFTLICTLLMYYSDQTHAFNVPKGSKLDAIVNGTYFTMTTMSTVGFGDITPQTKSCKLFVMIIQLTTMFLGMRLFDSIVTMKPELLL